jgi:DNA-binding CsgD family transcriptional regulator/predicted GIY-YIG superfamily endonuclease
MDEIYYLYLITRDDGYRYVGVTKHPHRRSWQHRNGYGSTELKGRNFTLKILEEGSEEFISSLEDAAIKAYECTLNKVSGGKFGHGLVVSKNGRAKLNESDVYLIKCLIAEGITQKEVARRFGVSRQTVGGIATGANWKHVKGPITYGRICVPKDLREKLKQMKEEGMNSAEIAKQTGLKYATVYSHVRGKQ